MNPGDQHDIYEGNAPQDELPDWAQQNFLLFLDAVPDAMLVVSTQGRIANAQVEILFR
jgi:hypothetical protein